MKQVEMVHQEQMVNQDLLDHQARMATMAQMDLWDQRAKRGIVEILVLKEPVEIQETKVKNEMLEILV